MKVPCRAPLPTLPQADAGHLRRKFAACGPVVDVRLSKSKKPMNRHEEEQEAQPDRDAKEEEEEDADMEQREASDNEEEENDSEDEEEEAEEAGTASSNGPHGKKSSAGTKASTRK